MIAGLRSKNVEDNPADLNRYPRFSIIVPVKNEEAVISRCMESLLGQKYPKEQMEMMIIDGGSSDDTISICRDYEQKVGGMIRILVQVGSKGKPSALKEALNFASGEIIGVFDADSVLASDVLAKAAQCFERQPISALQGMTASVNERENRLTRLIAKEERIWFQALIAGRDRLGLFVPLTGSCQFVRRETLMSVGGWREDSLAEDADLALKLARDGHTIKFERTVKSWQETPSSLGTLVRQRTRWYMGYFENLFRFGSLLRRPNLKVIDAELTLLGPGMMVLSIITLLCSVIQMAAARGEGDWTYWISTALTLTTLLSIGMALFLQEKPRSLRNMAWIPFIYLYWLLQTSIACWALLMLVLGRPRTWSRTVKKGTITSPCQGLSI